MKPEILISVCIPVFNTEKYLSECLKSVSDNGFDKIEVIVVDDFSSGRNENDWDCKKIVKKFSKNVKFPIRYIRMQKNCGLLEARRQGVYEAKGKYIFFLDSDDFLCTGSLNLLFQKAVSTDSDIVQGGGKCFYSSVSQNQFSSDEKDLQRKLDLQNARINHIYKGELFEGEILKSFLVESSHVAFLWGKLFTREICLSVFNVIPFLHIVLNEEYIFYIFACIFAKKYCGFDCDVYRYRIDSGITGDNKIENLQKWKQLCSASDVFNQIYCILEELSPEILKAAGFCKEYFFEIQKSQNTCLKSLIEQLDLRVLPEIRSQCFEILCETWGTEYVQKVKQAMENEKL